MDSSKGRSAIFAGTGLGKTRMQLAWASVVGGDVLILAPLAVDHQTVKEGEKWGWQSMLQHLMKTSDQGSILQTMKNG